jgi:hypothetical protein
VGNRAVFTLHSTAERIFSPLPASLRATAHQSYLSYLRARDGEPGPNAPAGRTRQLRLEPLLSDTSELNGVSKLVVDTVARMYAGESFAVHVLAAHKNPPAAIAHITAQEASHTRILAALLGIFQRPTKPQSLHWALRPLVLALVSLPHPFSTILLFIGELMGVLILLSVRRELERLPASSAKQSALDLVREIAIDEVGHLAYNHARLSAWQMRAAAVIARWQIPIHAYIEPLAAYSFRSAALGRFHWSMLPKDLTDEAWLPALQVKGRDASERMAA